MAEPTPPCGRDRRRPRRPAAALAALGLAVALAAPGAGAQDGAAPVPADPLSVDVELVLTADGSGSIDDDELAAQRAGYAAALADPRVLQAIADGFDGRIAVTYVEWGGAASQHTIVDWTVIDGPESARAFGARLIAEPRRAVGWNSISNALAYSLTEIRTNAYDGFRKVIDVSADSGQYGGRPLDQVRAEVLAEGVTINALALNFRGRGMSGPGGMPLSDYFRAVLIGGPGAFVLPVDREAELADAILRKLLLEIAGRTPDEADPTLARAFGVDRSGVDRSGVDGSESGR